MANAKKLTLNEREYSRSYGRALIHVLSVLNSIGGFEYNAAKGGYRELLIITKDSVTIEVRFERVDKKLILSAIDSDIEPKNVFLKMYRLPRYKENKSKDLAYEVLMDLASYI
jgi:hypothetical protein